MFRHLIGYICKNPLLWGVGLFVPAFASFVMNYGFAVGLERYTAELSGSDAEFQRVLVIMSATAISVAAASVIEDAARYCFSVFVVKTQNEMRNDIYKSIANARYSLLGDMDRGVLYTNYDGDAERAANLISGDLFAVFFPLVHAIGYFISLFSINRVIGGMIAGLTIAVMLLNLFFMNQFRGVERETLAAKEKFVGITDAAIRGKITVRQLQIGQMIAGQMERRADEIERQKSRYIRLNVWRKITLELLATICTSFMTPVACVLAVFDLIELPSVVMIAQICRFIILQTNCLGTAVVGLGVNRVSWERIRRVMELPDEAEVNAKQRGPDERAPLFAVGNSAVVLHNLRIAYSEKVVLDHVDMAIERGKITALIGPSGSGKTGLIHALMGMKEYSGEIYFYERDGKAVSACNLYPQDLRGRIAYCPERSQLFGSASVMENLLYAAPQKARADLEQLLEKLDLQDLDLSQRADTLSGGQRRRIALGRALLKGSDFFILDEPRAALDAETERLVLQILSDLKRRGKTVLLISHRQSTLEIADNFFMIEDKGVRIHFSNASIGATSSPSFPA